MTSRRYLGLVAAVAAERVAELLVARRNGRRTRQRGAVEVGAGHYPVMVALHLALLVAAPTEAALRARRPSPAAIVGLVGAVAVAQGLRWWCIATLGPRWNTRILVVPGLPPVRSGPYRWLDHPNYVAVVVEGLALPLAGGAWRTAAGFGVLNAALLRVRVRAEEQALAWAEQQR